MNQYRKHLYVKKVSKYSSELKTLFLALKLNKCLEINQVFCTGMF